MSAYEYHVLPAPRKGSSAKGVNGGAAKFANAITEMMNTMAEGGWEYLRADTLPCEERQGLTGKTVKYHSMLVFRRPVQADENTDPLLALPVPDDSPTEEETWQVPEPQDTDHAEENQYGPGTVEGPAEGHSDEFHEEYEQETPPDRTPV